MRSRSGSRQLWERRRSAIALARSVALVRVAGAVLKAYARLKNARGAFDYADLIERALALVEKADAAWVLYKLDKGIEHFLIDEAQDTSRAQWAILVRLAEELLSGEGAGSTRAHVLRGWRREAVDLLVPGRRAGVV